MPKITVESGWSIDTDEKDYEAIYIRIDRTEIILPKEDAWKVMDQLIANFSTQASES